MIKKTVVNPLWDEDIGYLAFKAIPYDENAGNLEDDIDDHKRKIWQAGYEEARKNHLNDNAQIVQWMYSKNYITGISISELGKEFARHLRK